MSPKCPFCKSKNKKLKIRRNEFSLFICKNCALGYIDPMPQKSQIQDLYSKDYFQNSQEIVHGYINYSQMEKVLAAEAVKRLRFISNFTHKKTLLDVGCGLGIFLKIAKSSEYEVAGNDISSYAKNYVSKKNKIDFYLGPIDTLTLPKNTFDIVTAWDVLEHIPQVNLAFKSIHRSLKKGGYLILTTPDINSWDAKMMRSFWYGYQKIPEHLLFFSTDSIKNVLEKNGFKVIKIRGWGFERNLQFILTKASIYIPHIDKLLLPILKILNIENKSIYLPLTDMIVVAQKNEL